MFKKKKNNIETSNFNGMEQPEKKGKKLKIVVGIIIALAIIGAIGSGDEDKETDAKNKETTKVAEETTVEETTVEETTTAKPVTAESLYNDWVAEQFSVWDGKCRPLVDLVKNNMNDPKSFEHVETGYTNRGTGIGIDVTMKYRGKNAFGGVVTNYVSAFLDYENQIISITATE